MTHADHPLQPLSDGIPVTSDASTAELSTSTASSVTIRPATPADIATLVALIQALAEYEKLSHEVTGSPEDLAQNLFGDRPYAEAVIAEIDGTVAGMALYFYNFSTFLMQPGLYLEDLFVLPTYRRRGVGQALFRYLGQLALSQGCGRFEWSVLDWNTPAIEFYQRMGAELKPEWQLCRITGDRLQAFGRG
ncbi:MAG: GNAT family N-acetyltransferase [Spirulina sp.]